VSDATPPIDGGAVLCPTCGQPATRAFGPDDGLECRNEACPEFGQPLREGEPAVGDEPSPAGPDRH
jgi:hypothetical protein